MAPRSRGSTSKSASSSATVKQSYAYTPLGQGKKLDTSPKIFWDAFQRRKSTLAKSTLAHHNDNDAQDDDKDVQSNQEEPFRVGSTVMVEHTTPLPLVGLVTQIWTVPDDESKNGENQENGSNEDGDEDEEHDEDDDFIPLWCKIRFFYWPDDLTRTTKTRLKGLISPNEIFYTHRLPRFGHSSRGTSRSQAAAESSITDNFAQGHSLLESDGFTVSEILGHVYIHTTPQEQSPTSTISHKGQNIQQHLYCVKAVDPMKELFWTIDYTAIHNQGLEGKGWDVKVAEEEFKGKALTAWADEERKKAKKAGKPIPGGQDDESKKKPAVKRKSTASSNRRRRRQESSASESDSDSDSSDESDTDDDSDDDEEEEEEYEDLDDSDEEFASSHRRRKRTATSAPSTPRKRRPTSTLARPTPRSRRIIDLRREARTQLQDRNTAASSGAFLPNPTSSLPLQFESASQLDKMTSHERAKRLLHVSTTPSTLPCRSSQAENLLCLLEDSLDSGLGSCIYISGVPGTGKTATVRGVISQLQQRSTRGEVNPFDFLEINGMKVADAAEAYSMLWSVVGERNNQSSSSRRRSPKAALSLLSKHYSSSSHSIGGTTIVLMDELDQLLTSRQDVMYNLFNWPSAKNSRLIVIAVANTMDLPERTLNAKVASRLGMTRITFMPYNDKELGEIVRTRLGIGVEGKAFKEEAQNAIAQADNKEREDVDLKTGMDLDPDSDAVSSPTTLSRHRMYLSAIAGCEDIFIDDAITYAAKRISNVSGDARRMLDVCRRAVERCESRSSGSKISILDIREILDGMVKSSRPQHISKSLSLHCKMILISILQLSRKTGLEEIKLEDVQIHWKSLCLLHGIPSIGKSSWKALLVGMETLVGFNLIFWVGTNVGIGKSFTQGRVFVNSALVKYDEIRLVLEHDDEDSRIRGMLA
ncbi:unnamed protein product [Sympodiomycopsis kandeliae]